MSSKFYNRNETKLWLLDVSKAAEEKLDEREFEDLVDEIYDLSDAIAEEVSEDAYQEGYDAASYELDDTGSDLEDLLSENTVLFTKLYTGGIEANKDDVLMFLEKLSGKILKW